MYHFLKKSFVAYLNWKLLFIQPFNMLVLSVLQVRMTISLIPCPFKVSMIRSSLSQAFSSELQKWSLAGTPLTQPSISLGLRSVMGANDVIVLLVIIFQFFVFSLDSVPPVRILFEFIELAVCAFRKLAKLK